MKLSRPYRPKFIKTNTHFHLTCAILQTFLEAKGSQEEICRIYLKRIEHVYFKFDKTTTQSQALMDKLCKFIYAKVGYSSMYTYVIGHVDLVKENPF